MLKGFHYPLTPKGKSTLNPAPPWYYSADFLSAEFWADASAVVFGILAKLSLFEWWLATARLASGIRDRRF